MPLEGEPDDTKSKHDKETLAGDKEFEGCSVVAMNGEKSGASNVDTSNTGELLEEEPEEEYQTAGGASSVENEEANYHDTVCLCLTKNNIIRYGAIKIFENPNFDRLTLTLIGANCVTLALFDPLDVDCTGRCKALAVFDQIFALYFTFEMVVKMLALGVFRFGTDREVYFDSKWNQFDFVIVVTGLIDFVPGVEGGSLTSLRTFRVLRPLRAINKFPKMRVLVKLLMDTIPMLASVGMLCFFIFFVFGIVAVQFWKGVMHQRCFSTDIPRNSSVYSTSYYQTDDGDGEDPFICAMGDGGESTGLAACVDSQGVPSSYAVCRPDGPVPLYGAIHYDNILAAWVVLFQIITLEGWVDQMYFIQGAYSFHTGWLYFSALVVIGAFFAVNLALVVISSQFSNSKGSEMAAIEALEARAKEEQKKLYEEAKARGETLSCWAQFRSGDLFRKSDQQLEQERLARREKLNTINEGLGEGDAKVTVEANVARLDNNEDFPVTQAEADAQGGIHVARYAVRKFTVIDERFGNFIMGAIALNVLLMATEHYDQPEALTKFLDVANYIFCGIFAIELVLKLFALGFSEYFSESFNCFDCCIVIISFVEIGMGGGGLAVLRMLRLVRVFKLVKFLPELQRQIAIMGETLGSVMSFLTLLALFIFIFAILGMFIFGGKMTYEETDEYGTYKVTSRKNFDTLLWALVTIFQTLTLEDWNAGMYDGVRGTETQWAALYYILLIMLGNYIMFNLFVAILIDGFGGEEEKEEEQEEMGQQVETLRGNPTDGVIKGRRVSKVEAQEMLAAVANLHAHPAKASEGSGVGSCSGARQRAGVHGQASPGIHMTLRSSSVSALGTGSGVGDVGAAGVAELDASGPNATSEVAELSKPIENPATKYVQEDTAQNGEEAKVAGEEAQVSDAPVEVPPRRDYALCLLPPDNVVRRQCNALWSYPRFDQFIMTCIILNSICMAMERPAIKDDSAERVFQNVAGHIFTFIFSVEMIIKVIGMGVFYGPNPYWSNPWNRLDGVIVLISWLDLVLTIAGVTGGMLSILKICRMLRALRPLRAISRLPGLKRIVNVLILSLAPIGTTLIIVAVFFFLFGVLGGQIFSGQFFHCDGGDRITMEKIKTKADCVAEMGENAWVNRPYNFDHLGRSLMTLFVLSSIDGWVEIMYHGIDIAGIDNQPIENNVEGLVVFFVGFLLIGGFFIINMFVGVIVENFQKNGAPAPTDDANAPPPKPEPEYDAFEDRENYSQWRRLVLAHATSTCFETFIAGVIILNVVVMGSEHYDPSIANYENNYDGMSASFQMFLRISNYIFTVIFVYELVVKYIAFGCQRYHMGSHPRSLAAWNNFDLFIVFISVIGILFDDIIGADNLPINPAILRILRILRVARILKLLKSAKDLVILLNTVSRSLAQVGNLGLLLFLMFFIYSALGIELFGRLACTDTNPCDGISEYANFENFGMAMLVLFRLSTGDNWNGMMKDGLRTAPPLAVNDTLLVEKYGNEYGCSFAVSCSSPDICCGGCDPAETCQENCCASAVMTPLFYISFCVLSTFVMLNLVVATLMGELERAGTEAEVAGHVEEESTVKSRVLEEDTTKTTPMETGDASIVVDTKAAIPDATSQPEHLLHSPDPSPAASLVEDGPPSGSRVKLEPLPMRPVSPAPSVFVPFAPETVDNEPDEVGPSNAEVADSEVGNN